MRVATRMICAASMLLAAAALTASVHHSRVEFYAEQQQVRHVATAIALEHSSTDARRQDTPSMVRARWSADGREHVETIASTPEIAPGDPLPIWVDDKGDHVTAPSSPNRADYDTVVDLVLLCVTVVFAATALVELRSPLTRLAR